MNGLQGLREAVERLDQTVAPGCDQGLQERSRGVQEAGGGHPG